MTILVSKSSTDSNEPLNRTGNREKGDEGTLSHTATR